MKNIFKYVKQMGYKNENGVFSLNKQLFFNVSRLCLISYLALLLLGIYFYCGFIIKQRFIHQIVYDEMVRQTYDTFSAFETYRAYVVTQSLKGLPVIGFIYFIFSIFFARLISLLPPMNNHNGISIFSFNLVRDFLSKKHDKYFYFSWVYLIKYGFWFILSFYGFKEGYLLKESLIIKIFCISYIACLLLLVAVRCLYSFFNTKLVYSVKGISLRFTIEMIFLPIMLYCYILFLNKYAGVVYSYGTWIFGTFIFEKFIWPTF